MDFFSEKEKVTECINKNRRKGSHVAKRLHDRGDYVRIIDIQPISAELESYFTEYIFGDLRDLNVCRNAIRDIQWVFHFAANGADSFATYIANHMMTVNITQAAIERGVERFFYASSDHVSIVDNNGSDLKRKDSEEHKDHPRNLYYCEKLNGETFLTELVKIYSPNGEKYPMQIRIGRLCDIFGEGNDWIGGRKYFPASLIREAIHSVEEGNYEIESDYSEPLNIEPVETLTIKELAEIAFETARFHRSDIRMNVNEKRLACMERTSTWVQDEIKKEYERHKKYSTKSAFIRELRKNERKMLEEIKFGILLPITSRGLKNPEDCLSHLRNFARSLHDTTQADTARMNGNRFTIKVFVGVDVNDDLFHPIKNNIAEQILKEHGVMDIETREFDLPPGWVCKIWNDLAMDAYGQQCDYIVLFGDDIVLESTNWMSKIHGGFMKVSNEKKVPRGFGCIAFTEATFPGFPTFPVMSRLHVDMFHGRPFPEILTNQDADIFLFQLYRRWGCSVMLNNVKLRNLIGGSKKGRYERVFHDWSYSVLDDAVLKVEEWMRENLKNPIPRLVTLDVVVPSYRVNMQYLEPIINLKKPDTISTMTIIIVDNPTSPRIVNLKSYEYNAFFRFRQNKDNIGVSESRNRGIAESSADYILFLDDDVLPDDDILIEAEKVIRKFPSACGFVCYVNFPDPEKSIFKNAVEMSDLMYFWKIAKEVDEDVPWGVGANLIVRRYKDDIKFDSSFPKSGGGEDVDYCIRKKQFFAKNVPNGEGFHGAPMVRVTHLWWNNGKRSYFRIANWAYGDGLLIKKYPEYAYRDSVPNSVELMMLLLLILILILPVTLIFNDRTWNTVTLVIFISIPLVIAANMLVDIDRHVRREPERHVPKLRGNRRVLAAAESSIIRMISEGGRLFGQIKRKEW
ncbi:10332_t:CDS:2, partial [Acaulospora colombiana]